VALAHTCNPIYSGSRDQEERGSKPARANSSVRHYLEKPFTNIGLVSDSRWRPWVQAMSKRLWDSQRRLYPWQMDKIWAGSMGCKYSFCSSYVQFVLFFFFFCGTGAWTQRLTLVRQVLLLFEPFCQLFFCDGCYSRQCLANYFPRAGFKPRSSWSLPPE
jgi:hypothetical protein